MVIQLSCTCAQPSTSWIKKCTQYGDSSSKILIVLQFRTFLETEILLSTTPKWIATRPSKSALDHPMWSETYSIQVSRLLKFTSIGNYKKCFERVFY